ncbi:MAG: DNA polymerase III subunit beta [Fusobacterium mortiferum]|uniref:Beta sliding clamp n=1 Tax=Fusobacterium mortiferum ATCC 9817 TaxID=469616 RepID=A0ABN5J9R0_FUSMR|nr:MULTISPECIES: DNA polymerase III subunit beta [Fusobacterium]AVQ19016.1 DNA polymerase III subunit beta [Fusobacterium mortiferum ATCC 9817]EEO35267.1 DNA polymerase III, beta subunit [Fusobacterium mortiferum ATCC 9817]MCF2626762.1 DNA polymerase III subunit beta [Fusobacterium mortiferum]MCF2698153.1 DNA polymerase III subunit beta [Fusobacterium mortiferum]MCI6381682.1 DNA polymerase III subunit beta [Fusobacterium mortiferum]
MKIQIERIEFLKRLKVVEKTITENKIKPIISCAYIETRGDNLFFCGTNLETTITTEMKCKEVIESGKIVFQHQLVEEYLKELKDEFVVFSEIDGNLVIESSDSSSEFSLMNVEDFPKILVDEDFSQKEEIFKINSIELAEILEKVKYAASSSSDNLSINCVRMENENKKLKFITTDTYRLVYLEKEIEKINENIDVSIPLNTVEALTKLLRSIESTDISFYFINRQIFFKMEEVLVISRIIDMSFPNYKGILGNNSYNKKLTINAEVFLKMLKRITIFVRNNNETKYGATFYLEKKEMQVHGVNEVAKINEVLEVNYEGENIKIALNTKFLSDFVQTLNKNKDITLEFIASNSSVKIKEEEANDYLYVLMPLALKD